MENQNNGNDVNVIVSSQKEGAAVAGALAGVGTPVAVVSALGVPGLSAAGITSGLATMGLGSAALGLCAVPVVGWLAGAFVYSLFSDD